MAVLCIHGLIMLLIVDILKAGRLQNLKLSTTITSRFTCMKSFIFNEFSYSSWRFFKKLSRFGKIENLIIHSKRCHNNLCLNQAAAPFIMTVNRPVSYES
ncbi:hypothetical protein SGGMMB4_01706 [Sodalis glossinidius str. 'morsitans']|uniref:Uncharacterized protein n=1 Tax=Sodalis glossinidius (strain morsitans) TaxID=343509 RepID=A0A193QH87_SODGM|nr:hypothetical protein SGGMMB4_01706 [Sodalis glossinidius str. 'morsitans']